MSATEIKALDTGKILYGKHSYRIKKTLGRGGFGITYLAESQVFDGNIPHNVSYTIKEFCMNGTASRNPDGSLSISESQREMVSECMNDFQKEAKRLRDIHHEGIVPVNEIIETNGTVYYVMEYLGDISLSRFVKEQGGKLEESLACDITANVARALHFLHCNNLTHLDVKPDNIMLVEKNGTLHPVLIDFGLAKHYKPNGTLTSRAMGMGHSDGFSPIEQYAGLETFTPQADVYALGATLFFMLTGIVPVKASDITTAYLYKKLPEGTGEITLRTILGAMQKLKENRIPSMPSFLESLGYSNEETANGGIQTKYVRIQKRQQIYKLTLAVLATLIVVGTLFLFFIPTELSETSGTVSVQTTDTLKNDTTQIEAASQVASNHNEEVSDAPPSVTPEEQPIRKEQQSQLTTQEKQSKPQEATSRTGILELGYGQWKGRIENGKPNGQGTLTFTTTHRIDSRDPNKRMAKAGERIEGSYINGHLDEGRWYKSDGSTEYIMLGE